MGVVLDQVDLGGGVGVEGVNEGEGGFKGGGGGDSGVVAKACDYCVLVHDDPPFRVGVGEGISPPNTPTDLHCRCQSLHQ